MSRGLRPRRSRGLLLAGLQGLLLLSLVGQLLLERSLRPRGWARSEPVDPDLPIRGRYLSLRLVVPAPGLASAGQASVRLRQQGGRLMAEGAGAPEAQAAEASRPETSAPLAASIERRDGRTVALPIRPLAFFLPEGVADPTAGSGPERLWVEVTLPRRGPPRPIRLGVERQGRIVPFAPELPGHAGGMSVR